MEFIKKALVQVKEHFLSLTTSQKLVYILLVILIAISSVWTIVWTAKPEMIPLLDQTFSDTQLANIENRLDMWGVKYKVENGKIYVRRQDQNRLLARLQLANALPSDVSEGWRNLILKSDMWLPAEDRRRRWQLAREQRLAQVIQLMDGVREAHVIINTGSKRLLSGGPSSDPSAAVYLQMEPGVKPSRKIIEAVADLVSGAVNRLERDRVRIVANGIPYHVSNDDSLFNADVLETRRQYERHFGEKIKEVLGIPNALVGVFVDLETETIQTQEQKYGEPVVSREHNIEDVSEEPQLSGEPGVRPNTGLSVPTAPPKVNKTSKTESETEYAGKRDVTTIIKHNLAGTVKTIRATINIPHSYFEEIYKKQTGKKENPTEADLKPIIKAQLEDIRKKVMPIINTTNPKLVEVSWFYDTQELGGSAVLASSGSVSGLGEFSQYAKPLGLIVLAFSSLLMVLMTLKKATTASVSLPDIEKGTEKGEPPPLEADDGPVGEADTSDGFLQAIEIDEDTVRTKKMAEQVSTLVKEDPAGAATLIKQWIKKDE